MCGIQGWIAKPEQAQSDLRVMAHRGPDDTGMIRLATRDGGYAIGLAHNRLSILDLSPAGHQPMSDRKCTLWVSFNSEIYNYPELARELGACSHHFRSRSDAEVLLHGYEEWGERLPERLRGMFAFALWDAAQERLLLARHRSVALPLALPTTTAVAIAPDVG